MVLDEKPQTQTAILVVEDEPSLLMVVSESLRDAGYVVWEAGDGEAALLIIKSHPDIDLLLTDVKMPGMNGHALSEYARRIRPNLPVLFMSGYSKETLPLAPDGHQATAFLAKPFTPFDLLRKVRHILDERTSRA